MNYIVTDSIRTEQINSLKQVASNISCYDAMKSVFDHLDANCIEQAVSECESIISSYKDNPKKYEQYIQFWHILFDFLTKKHVSPIYSIPVSIITDLTNYFQSDKCKQKDVIITMTTCKRMDLTYRTINSMLYCVTDIKDHIQSFVVIDDNSSEEDRTRLLETYPFITLIRKTPEQKGHPRSMNMLLDILRNVEYQFHIEDDWEFFFPSDYITRCKKVCELSDTIGQCLLNRDYGEDQISINKIGGSTMKEAPWGEVYYEHRYFSGNELQIETAKCGKANNLYWPHFSFRVGLTKTSIYSTCGSFNEKAQHFEMEYGHRYTQAGYRTVFLDRVYCTHIGRRTYERNDVSKKNAYDLNNEVQFGESQRLQSEQTNTQPDKVYIKTVVINLRRRKDRLLRFLKENYSELKNVHIFDAHDGKKFTPNSKLQRLFQTGDYHYRRGIMGVACSMIQVWKDFYTDPLHNILIVLEDDVKCTPNFMQKCITLLNENHNQFDIIYAHMNPYPQFNNQSFYSTTEKPRLERYSTQKMMSVNMGSLAATIFTKKAVEVILEDISQKGVYNAIDWVAMKTCDKLRAFACTPFLAFADCFQTNNQKDTDIQMEYNTCSLPNWTKYEIEYWENQLKGTKKNNKIRLVTTETSSSALVDYIKSLGYPIYTIKIGDVKQNDILLRTNITPNDKYNHITIVPGDKPIEPLAALWYATDTIKIVVPAQYITDTIQAEKTWRDSYLNKCKPC